MLVIMPSVKLPQPFFNKLNEEISRPRLRLFHKSPSNSIHIKKKKFEKKKREKKMQKKKNKGDEFDILRNICIVNDSLYQLFEYLNCLVETENPLLWLRIFVYDDIESYKKECERTNAAKSGNYSIKSVKHNSKYKNNWNPSRFH